MSQTIGSTVTDVGADVPNAIYNKTFFSDPINGNTKTGDGSQAKPWGKLSEIWAAHLFDGTDKIAGKIHSGDRLCLLTGNHGPLKITAYGMFTVANKDYITIEAVSGARPIVEGLKIQGLKDNVHIQGVDDNTCRKWAFRGLVVQSPPGVTADTRDELIYANQSENIVIDNCTVYSRLDLLKTVDEWSNLSATCGIFFTNCTKYTVSNNTVKNVMNGMAIHGKSALVNGNFIDYTANDGIDVGASQVVISKNKITNHYGHWNGADKLHPKGFHHDAIQIWTNADDAETRDVTVDSNTVIYSTGAYFQDDLVTSMPRGDITLGEDYWQGISVFNDGKPKFNMTITNNIVVAAAFHGISFAGVDSLLIAHNLVIDQSSKRGLWLGVFVKDDATHSSPTNVLIENNICNVLNVIPGMTVRNNIALLPSKTHHDYLFPAVSPVPTIIVKDPSTLFVLMNLSTGQFDFKLKAGSPAIGKGILDANVPIDILNKQRAKNSKDGLTTDIGPYVYVP